jgi:hypothetical protein
LKCEYSGHCILKMYACDGEQDCLDGTDERGCPAVPDQEILHSAPIAPAAEQNKTAPVVPKRITIIKVSGRTCK